MRMWRGTDPSHSLQISHPLDHYRLEARRKSGRKSGLDCLLRSSERPAGRAVVTPANNSKSTASLPGVALPSPLPPRRTIFICEGRFPADIIVMMAHLIKLFNCSGNHYHHHRCSIIHHFWRALLTSGAHSPALLKRGQISPDFAWSLSRLRPKLSRVLPESLQ